MKYLQWFLLLFTTYAINTNMPTQHIHQHQHNDNITNIHITIDISTALAALYDQAIQKAKPIFTIKKTGLIIMLPATLYWLTVERRLKQGIALIEDQSAWCNWKRGIQQSHLTVIPYTDLEHDFSIDLQVKYMSLPIGISLLQSAFLHDISSEMSCLTHCKNYIQQINKLKVSCLFSKIPVGLIEEKIARLHFIERLFVIQYHNKGTVSQNSQSKISELQVNA